MSIRQALGLQASQQQLQQAITAATTSTPTPGYEPSLYGYATPWGSSDLARIIANDVFGADRPVNTREAAMRIPAIARGRNLVVSTICRFPMVGATAAGQLAAQPAWLQAAGNGQSSQLRMAWTVDDLMFYGWSCWWRDNNPDGTIATVSRVDQADWEIDDDNNVLVNGDRANRGKTPDVILIPGLHEGLLSFGKEALDDIRTLYRNVRARILNPVPQLDLHQVEGEDLTDPEIDALIDRWSAARQGGNGGVGYTSKHIEAKELGVGGDAQLLIEARNAAAVDCARLIGVHAGLIDATAPKASLNYETATGRNQEFVDFDLALYMTPITARLSMDDVCGEGEHVSFDLGDFTNLAPSPTGPTLRD